MSAFARVRVSRPTFSLMPDVFDRRMTAAVGTQTLNAAETCERSRPQVAVEAFTRSHGVWASAEYRDPVERRPNLCGIKVVVSNVATSHNLLTYISLCVYGGGEGGFEPNRNEPKASCLMPEDHANRHPLASRVVAESVGFELCQAS